MVDSDPTAYPLSWPVDWRRTPAGERRRTPFSRRERASFGDYHSQVKRGLTISQALDRLEVEIGRLGASELVVSSNIRSRLDGRPYSREARPDDPGVAVYFKLAGKPKVLACDRWNDVAGNIAAIAKHIEALRGQERWGVGSLERAFTGYAALPHLDGTRKWYEVLGAPPGEVIDKDWIERRYRELAFLHHPDRGGDAITFSRITRAREEALEDIKR